MTGTDLSASDLDTTLSRAVEQARFAALVERGDSSLDLVLTRDTHLQLPFAPLPELAHAWLEDRRISASARVNETGQLVITLSTPTAVHQIISHLLEPRFLIHEAAARLREALSARDVNGSVAVRNTASLDLVFAKDEELGDALRFTALLGAPDIADGLDLHRRRGVRRFADRIQWLLTGLTGTPVPTEFALECRHDPAELVVYLTHDQAQTVTSRLVPGVPEKEDSFSGCADGAPR